MFWARGFPPGPSLDPLAVHYIHCAYICWSLFQAAGQNVGGTSILKAEIEFVSQLEDGTVENT